MKEQAITAALIAGFLACICALLGPVVVPSILTWTGWAICPTGTTVDVSKGPLLPRDGYGYPVRVHCVDQNGRAVEASSLLAFLILSGTLFLPLFPIMLFNMVRVKRGAASAPTQLPVLPKPLRPEHEQELQVLVSGGEKIRAIKRLREITGLGLKEAKNYVEYLARLPPGVATPAHPPPGSPRAGAPSSWGQEPEHDDADAGTMAKLHELKQMLEAGLISPADYEAKKRELLSRM